jgi:succinyl-diaminopimelate desuccinylase
MKELLKKLIQADSTAQKGELQAAKIISDEFASSDVIESHIDIWDETRANITARINSTGQKPGLLFLCHLDVVGASEEKWQHSPFGAVEAEGKIHGRGSADMKGGITAAAAAIKQVIESGTQLQGDIIFFAAAGEETDSCGAKRFIQNMTGQLPKLAGVIVPEPTDFAVVTAHRGILWLEITTAGKAAHGSTPHLGINAIISMKELLNELENFKIRYTPHKLLGDCSMSINTITGGKAINIIPDKCTIGIDIRTLPGQNKQNIIDDFEKIFAKLKQKNPKFDAQVSIAREVLPLETDTNAKFVKDFCSCLGADETKAVGFTTDGPFAAGLGAPVVIFGPGNPDLCHKPDEHIEIADLEKAVDYYKNIILKFLT